MGWLKNTIKNIGSAVKKAAGPIVQTALSLVPGVGGIAASAAAFAMNKAAKPAAPGQAQAKSGSSAPQKQAPTGKPTGQQAEPKPDGFVAKAMSFLKKNWIWIVLAIALPIVVVVLIRAFSNRKKTASSGRIAAARKARAAKLAKAKEKPKR